MESGGDEFVDTASDARDVVVDELDVEDRRCELVVDPRSFQPSPDGFGRGVVSRDEAMLELFERGGANPEEERIGIELADLASPVQFDVEDDHVAGGTCGFDR